MKCVDFKNLSKRFATKKGLPREASDSTEYAAWSDHSNVCSACSDWVQAETVRRRGEDPKKYPCVHIAYHVTEKCGQNADAWECPDITLVFNKKSGAFGIPVRDGGSSYIQIGFCPWCGVQLKASSRRRNDD